MPFRSHTYQCKVLMGFKALEGWYIYTTVHTLQHVTQETQLLLTNNAFVQSLAL